MKQIVKSGFNAVAWKTYTHIIHLSLRLTLGSLIIKPTIRRSLLLLTEKPLGFLSAKSRAEFSRLSFGKSRPRLNVFFLMGFNPRILHKSIFSRRKRSSSLKLLLLLLHHVLYLRILVSFILHVLIFLVNNDLVYGLLLNWNGSRKFYAASHMRFDWGFLLLRAFWRLDFYHRYKVGRFVS